MTTYSAVLNMLAQLDLSDRNIQVRKQISADGRWEDRMPWLRFLKRNRKNDSQDATTPDDWMQYLIH
jgi:hypothetical protein